MKDLNNPVEQFTLFQPSPGVLVEGCGMNGSHGNYNGCAQSDSREPQKSLMGFRFSPFALRTSLFLLLPFLLAFKWIDPLYQKVEQANKQFAEQKYEEAAQIYSDAQLDAPQSKELNYNLGNALYKQGKFDKAIEEYQKARGSGDNRLESQILYNQGNAQYKLGPEKWQDSVNSYVEALKLNPDLKEAKYNLELVRKKIKEQLDKQKDQQQNQQQQQQQQQEQNNEQGQSEPQKQGEATPTPSGGTGNEGSGEEKKDEQGQEQTAGEMKEMTKEEAERLLNSLESQDKQLEQLPQQMQGRGGNPEIDW